MLHGHLADYLFLEHANRKTVTTLDVVYALKKQGNTIYVSAA